MTIGLCYNTAKVKIVCIIFWEKIKFIFGLKLFDGSVHKNQQFLLL